MDSVRLNSTDFDDSVGSFIDCVSRMEEVQRQFRLGIDKLVTAMGMHAENEACIATGCVPKYGEGHFQSI